MKSTFIPALVSSAITVVPQADVVRAVQKVQIIMGISRGETRHDRDI
jgi:hypothetical protein